VSGDEAHGVLHRHLRPRAHREVHGVGRVAEQRDRRAADPVAPVPGPAGPEVAPPKVVDQQRVSVEALEVRLALLVTGTWRLGDVELVESGGTPRCLVGLHDRVEDPLLIGSRGRRRPRAARARARMCALRRGAWCRTR
jgi:hypothetical protein